MTAARQGISGLAKGWTRLTPRLLPFADVFTPELPLGRLLRLSLFQLSVGMAAVLLIGTLNRVMIVELGVPAGLVAAMVGLPLVFAPLRALVGFRSDTHRSALGWRRVPYLWMGTLLQFGGLSIMPFALILLSGDSNGPPWVGHVAAAMAFLLVGAGLHTVQTVGLALATDLAPAEAQPRVVALLTVALLLGMVVSASAFGALLADFSQVRLVRVVQGAAVATVLLNVAALWKQEARDPARTAGAGAKPSFGEAWRALRREGPWTRRLAVAVIGTAAFGMQDVLLEPYGGQVLRLGVGGTTALTAVLACAGIAGILAAARMVGLGRDPHRVAAAGALCGAAAFAAVVFAAPLGAVPLFVLGTALIGLGGGLFAHATLTACMRAAPEGQVGLALGAWGAAQATAAGCAMAFGGLLRDLVANRAEAGGLGPVLATPATGYAAVYLLEIALLFATLAAMGPLVRTTAAAAAPPPAPANAKHAEV
ncbi:MAG: BCD family MFS transporter [Acetobacteraceae bacterium]|nr:BCD family MFS transporter [Acetobacteraceae bacterium]